MSEYLSQLIAVDFPFTETDIGGTNTNGSDTSLHWVSMEDFETFLCKVELGTWNAGDDLDECHLEQAKDSAGSYSKALTTSAASGDYDTAAPIDADGNWVILECHASDLDDGFTHVRVHASEGGNTGTDNVSAVYVRGGSRVKRDQLNGADSSGVYVYVKPS